MIARLITACFTRPILAVLLTLAGAGLGTVWLQDLRRDVFPDLSVPVFNVIVQNPAMGAEELETGESVARHRREEERSQRKQRRRDDRIDEWPHERRLRLQRRPVLAESIAGEERHRGAEEFRLGQRRIGEHQPERCEPEKR